MNPKARVITTIFHWIIPQFSTYCVIRGLFVRWTLSLLLCMSFNLVAPPPIPADDNIQQAVVKILVTRRLPDMLRPWITMNSPEISSTGVVIERNRILTTANVVAYASQIYIQPYQSADKLPAQVLMAAPGINLAILTLEDESFFNTHPALHFEKELPKVKDTVNVYGYAIGGSEQSITEGIVSRIEYAAIRVDVQGLRIQIDAALNPGNNGGPAVVNNKIVGLAYGIRPDNPPSSQPGARPGSRPMAVENIGYLIPVEEINMFLDDIADGAYEGKPRIQSIYYQTCENQAFRDWLGLKEDITGLLVRRIRVNEPDYPLKEGDLITHIGSYAIDSEGQIRVRDDLRLSAGYQVPHLVRAGKVPLTVFRKGQTLELKVPVSTKSKRLIRDGEDEYPRYFIYGPMVFTPVTMQYAAMVFRSSQRTSLEGSPLYTRQTDLVAFEGEELVALAPPLLSHGITKGYDPMRVTGVVSQVNGIAIKNITHLVETLRDAKDEYITIKFEILFLILKHVHIFYEKYITIKFEILFLILKHVHIFAKNI